MDAQQQEWNWYFGLYAAVNFSTGNPVSVSGSAIVGGEGCASISDNLGNLLFYTDGVDVWDRTNNVMPNGYLVGAETSTQSAVIVPKPDSAGIYYIFTSDGGGVGMYGICYSEVDMSLNTGLGDVSIANVQLVTPASEKLVAAKHCNGHDYWVIAHQWATDAYYVYQVTNAGVSAPVITHIGNVVSGQDFGGYLKVSPNGHKVADALVGSNVVELYDFDNSTGILSNLITIPTMQWPYGLSFSPDNNKIYVQGLANSPPLYQYDITSNNLAIILASQFQVSANQQNSGAIQLGTDNKLYVGIDGSSYLDVINFPNILGAGCNYVSNAVPLGFGTCLYGLPNFIDAYSVPLPPFSENIDTSACSASLTLVATGTGTNYLWSTGDTTQSITVNTSGTYRVQVFNASECNVILNVADTFNVTISSTLLINLGHDTSLCPGDSLILIATHPNCTYLWSDSTTDSTLTVNSTGTYSVTVTNASGCTGTDSVTVSFNGITPTITGSLSFCTGSYTTLNAGSGYISYIWSTSATVDTIHVTTSGTYSVTVSGSGGCTGTASVIVTESANLTPDIIGDSILCSGGTTILDAGNGYTTYQWSTSATTETITVTIPGLYYVIVTNGTGCTGSDTVFINEFPPVHPTLTGTTSLCIGDSSTLKAGGGFVSYLWSNSATTDSLVVTTSGTYYVTVTNANGCAGSDSITVTFYPTATTAFTADTLNGCAPFTVLFNNTTSNATHYLWNFGDGNTDTVTNPTHIYIDSGTYTVTLIGYGGGGCNDTLIRTTYIHVILPPALTDSFDISPSAGCVGELISFTNHSTNATSYLWNFGDGNSSTVTNPTHTYTLLGTYNVTLYSINNTVCGMMIDSSKTQVIIYPNAIAAFDSPDTGGCPPYTVTFTNGSTLATSFSWNFGDGNTSTTLNPTHTYTTSGFYSVTLIAFGQNGCNDTLTLTNYIDVHNPAAITAQFHADTLTGCNPFTVDFFNTSINGSTYYWNFGDNTNDTSMNPIHTYTDSGSYTITLIVNNTSNGCVSAPDTLKIIDYIKVIDTPSVKSNFSGEPLIGCLPLTVNFNNTSTNATYYYWSFGDGALDTAKNPKHTYLDSGTYTVFLIVGDTGSVCKAKFDTITFKDYVTVEWCELFIPNVFSPNGDATNDYFKIIAEGYTNYHVTIFNRWGEKVFDNINVETQWNGKINNTGSDAADGTYYYILNITDPNGKPLTMKGALTLIR